MDNTNYDFQEELNMLKKWCSDCVHKGQTFLHDPCHDCSDEFSEANEFTPNYYEQEQKHN